MDLHEKWDWDSRKLPVRVRVESGNPAGDELRLRLQEIAQRLALETLKSEDVSSGDSKSKKKKSLGSVKLDDATVAKTLVDSTYNVPALMKHVTLSALGPAQMNVNKRFFRVPKSPPRKVMMDLQKSRLIRESDGEDKHHHNESAPISHPSRAGLHRTKKASAQNLNREITEDDVNAAKAMGDVFKPYHGDTFGTGGNYMGGMVYLSRMPHHSLPDKAYNATNNDTQSMGSISEADQISTNTSWDQLAKERSAKITCAATICGWSRHPQNIQRLYTEGALDAINRLAKEDDRKIRRYCAQAFRYMSEHQELCEQMIQIGSLPVLAELASSSRDAHISRSSAIAMLNLTRLQGKEGALVEDGAVLALMRLMNENEDLAGVCARGLFNLTCVDAPYSYIERVIKSFLGLAAAATLEVKHICASALCNLSDLKSIRPKLVEEGVVPVLGLLARGAEAKTRRVCAIVLQSLASTKACRLEMVAKGAVQVLYSLSNDNDANTLHYIASAIMRLALDPDNCVKMVNENGVSALCNICIRCPDMPKTTQPCAAAFQVLSRQESTKTFMVTEQCVPALVTLLRGSTDPNTLQFCLLAFCNLLTVEENHLPVLQQGGVMSIIEQCKNTEAGIRESCALALFNLSCGEAARKSAVAAGAVPALISIAKLEDIESQTRVAATLCNFASERLNISKMVDEGVIDTFIDLLKSAVPDTVKHCCAALCQLAQDSQSCDKIVELGAVPHIVVGVQNGDDSTKQSCCSVLSALSFQSQCRQQLVAMGALTALVTLSQMDDKDTSLRCALAFANLSCEPTVQGVMIKEGVLPILKRLSNSYSEENQMYVAKALCNLSCHIGSEGVMIEEDCVSSLMMIGMVRSVHHNTKQLCAKALQNLLGPDSQERLCEEGLVSTIASFSKLDDEPTMRICAQVFIFLSSNEYGRAKLVQKKAALFGLLGLLRSTDRTTVFIVGKTICNLLCFSDSQAAAVEVGAVKELEKIATSGDADSECDCANAYFLICDSEKNREMIINVNAMKVIILLARSPNVGTRRHAIRVIANLAQYANTREALLENNVVMALVALTEDTTQLRVDMLKLIAQSLSNLSLVESFTGRMVQEGVVSALMRVQSTVGDGSLMHFIANTLRNMALSDGTLEMMAEDGAIELLGMVCKFSQDGFSESVLYDASFACFHFALSSENMRKDLIKRGGLEIIAGAGTYESCHGFSVATMFLLSLNSDNRAEVASGATGELLVKLGMLDGVDVEITQNASQAMFMLSKSEKSRNSLVEVGLPAALVKLCKSENDDVRSSASQALKNLSSEGGDGLEEGTVSALIAMSEGATDNSVSNFDDSSLCEPVVRPVNEEMFELENKEKPAEFINAFKPLTVKVMKEGGGDAPINKGPAAPSPPSMASQHVPHKPVVDEEVDQKNEDEENLDKVMMFAKMTVPKELEGEDMLTMLDDDEDEGGSQPGNQDTLEEEPEEEAADKKTEELGHSQLRVSVRGGPGASAASRRSTVRSGRSSPASPPLPVRADPREQAMGPKEKAKARRKKRSMQRDKRVASKMAEGAEDAGVPFDVQAQSAGLY
jgi:hypothetical protein